MYLFEQTGNMKPTLGYATDRLGIFTFGVKGMCGGYTRVFVIQYITLLIFGIVTEDEWIVLFVAVAIVQ